MTKKMIGKMTKCLIMNEVNLLGAAVLTVANPRTGDGSNQAFVFWICVLCIIATFFLALTDKLDGVAGVFATSTALIFGYWLSEQKQKVKR